MVLGQGFNYMEGWIDERKGFRDGGPERGVVIRQGLDYIVVVAEFWHASLSGGFLIFCFVFLTEESMVHRLVLSIFLNRVAGKCSSRDTTDALPCHIYLPVCLWIMDHHNRAPKKNTSHRNTTLLIQRPCHQPGSPCQDPAGKWTTRRPPDDRKETQTVVYGHVSRSSGLTKTILQGTMKWKKRQGRQRKRWEDNIREWTGLEFGKENREKWRKLVAKSSVVPQRPSRLRDWWGGGGEKCKQSARLKSRILLKNINCRKICLSQCKNCVPCQKTENHRESCLPR